MYLFMVLVLMACAFAAIGMLRLVDGARGRRPETVLKSSYWLLAAVIAVVAGLGFLLTM